MIRVELELLHLHGCAIDDMKVVRGLGLSITKAPYSLYTADLGEVTDQHNVNLHSFAAYSQLYVYCQSCDTAM